MHPQRAQSTAHFGVVGRNQTAIAESSQILGREKAEASCIAYTACAPLFEFRSDGLRRVLYQRYAAGFRERLHRVHIRAAAKKVHWYDGADAWMRLQNMGGVV